MKKTKAILAAVLAATMLFSLTACGDNDDTKSSKKDKSESSSAEIAETNAAYNELVTEPINTEPAIVNSIITEPVTEPETEPVTESDKYVPSPDTQKQLDEGKEFALIDKDGKLVHWRGTRDLDKTNFIGSNLSDTIAIDRGNWRDWSYSSVNRDMESCHATIILESNVDTDYSKISKVPCLSFPDKFKHGGIITDENIINEYKTKYNHDGDVLVFRCYKYSDEKIRSMGYEFVDKYPYDEMPTDPDYMITMIVERTKVPSEMNYGVDNGWSEEETELDFNVYKTMKFWYEM